MCFEIKFTNYFIKTKIHRFAMGRKINIHLNIIVRMFLLIVVNFNTFNKFVYNGLKRFVLP